MQVSYLNTYWDIARFSLYHNYHFWLNRLLLLGTALFFGYQFSTLPFAHEHRDLVTLLTVLIMVAAMLAVIVLSSGILVLLTVPFRRNASYHRQCTLTLTDEGIRTETAMGNSFLIWAGVQKVVKTASFVGIYAGEHAAHIVPTRALGSPTKAREFYEYARSRWQAHRHSPRA